MYLLVDAVAYSGISANLLAIIYIRDVLSYSVYSYEPRIVVGTSIRPVVVCKAFCVFYSATWYYKVSKSHTESNLKISFEGGDQFWGAWLPGWLLPHLMHAEVVPVSKLFKRSIPFRDMLREPSCPTNLICTPPVRAVASLARVSCFVYSTAHVVQVFHRYYLKTIWGCIDLKMILSQTALDQM